MKTFTLPGGLAGPPSACSCALNRLDVFATGPGNTVWRWSLTSNGWGPPAPLLAGPASIPAVGVSAVASVSRIASTTGTAAADQQGAAATGTTGHPRRIASATSAAVAEDEAAIATSAAGTTGSAAAQ